MTEGEIYIQGRKHVTFDVGGLTQLDYLDLYKKFTYKAQESYRLDYIAEVELGQKKLDHSEFDTFKDFYTKGWQKFIEYNIVDVELVDRLEDKMKLIELALTMALIAYILILLCSTISRPRHYSTKDTQRLQLIESLMRR